jgi:hypothetical protein
VLLGTISCGGGGGGIQAQPPPALPIDLVTSLVEGTFTFDGASAPDSATENGRVYLVPVGGGGERTLLGETRFGSYGSLSVLAGSYRAGYEALTGANTAPANVGTPFGGNIDLVSDAVVHLDVPTVVVDATFTLNGGAFPASATENARFSLVPTAGGDEIALGDSSFGNATRRILPGSYDVLYSRVIGSDIPANQRARVMTAVPILTSTTLRIDVEAVTMQLRPQLDGSSFPATPAQSGRLELRRPATNDVVPLGSTEFGLIAAVVIPGTYDIVYSHVAGTSVPMNDEAVVAGDVLIDATHTAPTLDVQSALVTPAFTHNGAAFPAMGSWALISLRGTSPGDTFALGATSQAVPLPVRVVEGAYDVLYAHQFGTDLPQNSRALLEAAHVVAGDEVLAVAVTSVVVTPSFRHNGLGFPSSAGERAAFVLEGSQAGDTIPLGLSNVSPGGVRVVAGTYDVVYRHELGTSIPRNPGHRVVDDRSLVASQLLAIDVSSHLRLPSFTIDGQPPPDTALQSGSVSLRDSDGSLLPLGRTDLAPSSVRIIEGTYDVVYDFSAGTTQVARNSMTTVTTVVVD